MHEALKTCENSDQRYGYWLGRLSATADIQDFFTSIYLQLRDKFGDTEEVEAAFEQFQRAVNVVRGHELEPGDFNE